MKPYVFTAVVLSVLLRVPVAWAQFKFGTTAGDVGLPRGDLPEFLVRIINAFLILVAVIALAYIVYGGFRYITSQGNEEDTKAAKRIITFAVIGIMVIGLAAAIVNFVVDALFPGGGGPGSAAAP